jgi:hypothetical protein
VSVEHTLYECVSVALPVDGAGRGEIPVTVQRDGERIEHVVVPITLDDCSLASCDRPTEWYELPIRLDDGAEVDAVAVLRLEYPVIVSDTDRHRAATLLDQVGARPPGENLHREGTEVTFEPSGDELHPWTDVHFFTDRPVHIRLTAVPMDDGCAASETLESSGYQSEFDFRFATMCAGSTFGFEGTATETDGTVHVIERGLTYVAPPLDNVVRAQIDLLGGDEVAELGHVSRFEVLLDGQSPSVRRFDWTAPRRGSTDACMALDGSSARSRTAAPVIRLVGDELDVSVHLTVTATGGGDCRGAGRGPGDVQMVGSFSYEQLQSGAPLVLETAVGAPLRVRLTLTTDHLRWTA